MRSALAVAAQRTRNRSRSVSLNAVPPAEDSNDYLPDLAAIAASIIYRSPCDSEEGRPLYILNAAAFPDAFEVDYDSLLSYVLARLPGEDELLSGTEYEIVFFAGGPPESATAAKRTGPGMGWYLQAYHVLSRALRKKLQRLYIVHPRTWVRVLIGVFGTVVSPKFRRKIVHVNTLSQLALIMPIEKLLIPSSAYLHDRKLSPDIDVPYASGRRAFGALHPLPKNISTGQTRLPRVLRETTNFLLLEPCVETEGVFRIPPHNITSGVLKEAYDRGQRWIVWKEKGAEFVQPGMDQALMDEVRPEDAYNVHSAASLIKQWYRELRQPIFADTTYDFLREKYDAADAEVTPEDLVDLIMPASTRSPLTTTSREILTRHLLPLLSAVAVHEPKNKMNAENLAICFSMCLVCSSDQLADAKMSSIVRRVLQSAIAMWPQLRDGLGIDAQALQLDLQPPADPRDYEDPLEQDPYTRSSEDDVVETKAGHRIFLDDNEDASAPERAPTLPPRPRQRAITVAKEAREKMVDISADLASNLRQALPPLPKRSRANSAAKDQTLVDTSVPPAVPAIAQDVSTSGRSLEADIRSAPAMPSQPRGNFIITPSGLDSGNFIKRKPTPASAAGSSPASYCEETSTDNPPRYSTVFGRDGRSIDAAGPSVESDSNTLGSRNNGGDQKRLSCPPQTPGLGIPKRKPVSGDDKVDTSPISSTSSGTANSTHAQSAAKSAAQVAAAGLAQRLSARSESENARSFTRSPDSIQSDSDFVFRKPSWPASSNKQQLSIETLSKPILPSQQNQTVPTIKQPPSAAGGTSSSIYQPRPRAPSPGLLKRMSTMDAASWNPNLSNADKENFGIPTSKGSLGVGSAEPNKLNLKKASVDDLRRLYEERVNTAQSLKAAVASRRSSSSRIEGNSP
ncbi:Divergent CRAL/TRIO domain [Teratosphaeria destructans]|uniref:Divergent CRAL/TRIO domain n=1 Tax=Teratosphaeria destructans TaxID=418781 RepID=A0A9W7W560_9PEZI|nr:Divergent CRAL/TRIO domain [Teratosphaeria destructans]